MKCRTKEIVNANLIYNKPMVTLRASNLWGVEIPCPPNGLNRLFGYPKCDIYGVFDLPLDFLNDVQYNVFEQCSTRRHNYG